MLVSNLGRLTKCPPLGLRRAFAFGFVERLHSSQQR